jgi:hypothetical protein
MPETGDECRKRALALKTPRSCYPRQGYVLFSRSVREPSLTGQ